MCWYSYDRDGNRGGAVVVMVISGSSLINGNIQEIMVLKVAKVEIYRFNSCRQKAVWSPSLPSAFCVGLLAVGVVVSVGGGGGKCW